MTSPKSRKVSKATLPLLVMKFQKMLLLLSERLLPEIKNIVNLRKTYFLVNDVATCAHTTNDFYTVQRFDIVSLMFRK